jgi:hypothetical protein
MRSCAQARVLRVALALALVVIALATCQEYDFVFVPDINYAGLHWRFTVQQPSQADILFVIDNSSSMGPKQLVLQDSLSELLDALAPQDTSYRIGIVSTDVYGSQQDCHGQPLSFDPAWTGVGIGDCRRTNADGSPVVKLNYPHDGTRGRLIAAYDPERFEVVMNPTLVTAAEQAAFKALAPHDVSGVPWVIDRDAIRSQACAACGCAPAPCDVSSEPSCCMKGDSCFDNCANDVATALVTAYFRSNIAGLGIDGSSYESGLTGGLWAVGIDPAMAAANPTDESGDQAALTSGYNLTRAGQPNTLPGANGQSTSWLRDEALLSVLLVSDEPDCSVPQAVYDARAQYESMVTPVQPLSSMCYLPKVDQLAYSTSVMARLLEKKKGSPAHLATAFIGPLSKTGPAGSEDRSAVAADCVYYVDRGDGSQPPTACSCWSPAKDTPDYELWCNYTSSVVPPHTPDCDALGNSRYIDFVSSFSRHTFESICLTRPVGDCSLYTTVADCAAHTATQGCTWGSTAGACRQLGTGFGAALARFAQILTTSCFDLAQNMVPANGDPSYIVVQRATKADVDAGLAPSALPRVDCNGSQPGWCWVPPTGDQPPRICLQRIQRLIGDVYDVFLLVQDKQG